MLGCWPAGRLGLWGSTRFFKGTAESCSLLELFLGLEERWSLCPWAFLSLLISSRDPLWPRSVFLGLGERSTWSAQPSVALLGLAGLESLLFGFLVWVLGLVVRLWLWWESCCPLDLLACLPCSCPEPGDPDALGSPLENSSGAVVLGEDGDRSEVERETEDGEAGEDCPTDTESLGKLEAGMVTLSFEPGKQAVESKKRF